MREQIIEVVDPDISEAAKADVSDAPPQPPDQELASPSWT
jgi:hypothetical protein